uniref:TOG domain-containing protein n=1 Tax=Amphimedon queenslandica TaxID=400682 RepID=A0A1X7SLH5_AMPQE
VSFYIKESEASNHAVREAACTCIAELGNKISPDAVRPHVSQLVTALLDCFHDESWPVRDAACLACGNFIACFPDECHEYLSQLYPLFLANLEDSIPSVRQGAAVALGNLVKTYGKKEPDRGRDINFSF